MGKALFPSNRGLGRMHMQFSRIISSADLQTWKATSNGFSFVISFESRNSSGLRGRLGFVASASDLSKQERHKGRWLTFKDARRG